MRMESESESENGEWRVRVRVRVESDGCRIVAFALVAEKIVAFAQRGKENRIQRDSEKRKVCTAWRRNI